MATTNNDLRFYTPAQAIEYVGWLLAACADTNINKGIRLLNDLPNDEARAAAKAHAMELKSLYGED